MHGNVGFKQKATEIKGTKYSPISKIQLSAKFAIRHISLIYKWWRINEGWLYFHIQKFFYLHALFYKNTSLDFSQILRAIKNKISNGMQLIDWKLALFSLNLHCARNMWIKPIFVQWKNLSIALHNFLRQCWIASIRLVTFAIHLPLCQYVNRALTFCQDLL